MQIVPVHRELESKQHVVDNGDRDRSGDTVCKTRDKLAHKREEKGRKGRTVREHVRHHRDLVVHRRIRPQKLVNLSINRPMSPPLHERVEQQLATPIRVLLPAIQLVVDRQGHTLLEPAVGVRRPANNVPAQLQPERHVEIFGHVGLGPDLLDPVFVDEGGVLDGFPAEEGIVTDKGGDFTVGASCNAKRRSGLLQDDEK